MEKINKIKLISKANWIQKSDWFDAGLKKGIQQEQKRIIEIIDKEIKSIEKLNKDKTIIVNHNFWIAHINQLNELKQQIQEDKEQ